VFDTNAPPGITIGYPLALIAPPATFLKMSIGLAKGHWFVGNATSALSTLRITGDAENVREFGNIE
jgi:hypothetical protein